MGDRITPGIRNCLFPTAETERDPRNSIKRFFVDLFAAVQTFTIAAVIDAFHGFADALEPREIAALQRERAISRLPDHVEIAFIFAVTQHVTSVIFFKGPSSELCGASFNSKPLVRVSLIFSCFKSVNYGKQVGNFRETNPYDVDCLFD
jgi:hypothetical protein